MYRYETHLHTAITSACSVFQPEEIVEKYTRLGYAGVFVTDHFLNGNTTVPAELPWAERVKTFMQGYRAVKAQAEGTGLDVFFGFEYSYRGTDFLVYGLEEDWLISHPEVMEIKTSEFCEFVRKEGGLVVQAHPYREASYIDHIRLFPSNVDGMEVVNACRDERTNRLAEILAEAYGLIGFAGSDIHGKGQKALAGIEFKTKIATGKEFAARVLRGEGNYFVTADKETI